MSGRYKPFPGKHYVYLWKDPKNGRVRYVGKGQHNRAWEHKYTQYNQLLHRMLRKRAFEGFTCEPVIVFADTEKLAYELEEFLVDWIGRVNDDTGPLFNQMPGGFGPPSWKGRKRTPESVAKSAANRRGQKRTLIQPTKGRPWTKAQYLSRGMTPREER